MRRMCSKRLVGRPYVVRRRPARRGDMTSAEKLTDAFAAVRDVELEQALDLAEPDGVYRDSRQCAALALQSGTTTLLPPPPTPRPKRG